MIAALLAVWTAGELLIAGAFAWASALGLLLPIINRHAEILMLFARCTWLHDPKGLLVRLDEDDAPRLFDFLRKAAAHFGVRPPAQVIIEMNASAWINLKGFGNGATTLGLGYDLVAGLSERELQSVLAHEIAHAKFVQRGYKRWLSRGAARAVKLSRNLALIVEAHRRARKTFGAGEWVLSIVDPLTRLVVRRVAACSRHDEFEADYGAASICGARPLRQALQKVRQIETKIARITWSERIAHLREGRNFAAWLAGELACIETETGGPDVSDRYSTHPSLADRLAALMPDEGDLSSISDPGIAIFKDPNAVARHLIEELHRAAAGEEARRLRKRLQWLNRFRGSGELAGWRRFGATICLVSVAPLAALCFDPEPAWVACIFILMAIGLPIYRRCQYHTKGILPVPSFETIWENRLHFEGPSAREIREKAVSAEVDAALADLAATQRIATIQSIARKALGTGDYLRALVTIGRLPEREKHDPEVLVVGAIAHAGLGNREDAATFLNGATRRAGLETNDLLWGAAWALTLAGQPELAEPMLATLRRASPQTSTYLALLALCQSELGELQSATANARVALAEDPKSLMRIQLLAELLLQTGRLTEAEHVLSSVQLEAKKHADLCQLMIQLHLLKDDFAKADEWIADLEILGISGDRHLELGEILENARRDAMASAHFKAAQQDGFYPTAELGLARLARHSNERQLARQHALAALDCHRPVAPKSVPATAVFAAAIELLAATEMPIEEIAAWIAILDPDKDLGPYTACLFLVLARDARHAEQIVLEVVNATRPNEEPLPSAALQIRRAPEDRQPIGTARPGIQSFWK